MSLPLEKAAWSICLERLTTTRTQGGTAVKNPEVKYPALPVVIAQAMLAFQWKMHLVNGWSFGAPSLRHGSSAGPALLTGPHLQWHLSSLWHRDTQ